MDISKFSDEAFAAYLAAFTDGEGCISYDRPDRVHRHKFFIRITLANCVESVLRDIHARLGYGYIRSQKQKENWRERFVYIVSDLANCEKFLLLVRPYLQIKQDQADIALARVDESKQIHLQKYERNLAILEAAKSGKMRKDIARDFGVSPQLVSRICEGHKWPSVHKMYAKSKRRNELGKFTSILDLPRDPDRP